MPKAWPDRFSFADVGGEQPRRRRFAKPNLAVQHLIEK